jgi:hypothetical protein
LWHLVSKRRKGKRGTWWCIQKMTGKLYVSVARRTRGVSHPRHAEGCSSQANCCGWSRGGKKMTSWTLIAS